MAKAADYNLGEYSFPRGWFVVASGAQITGKPYNAHYFGEDVVIFRGESGKVVMLTAYCPHMGTHFGTSKTSYIVTAGLQVQGDNIRCPFHGWRFGPDGKCNDIPYFDGPIPQAARVRSWPVVERYGIVFCWNDPEGQEPDFDLPEYPEWDDSSWVRWTELYHLCDLPCHPIEIFDNTSDYAHHLCIHGAEIRYYENEVDRHIYRQKNSMLGLRRESGPEWARFRGASKGESLHENAPLISTETQYIGPGFAQSRFLEAEAVQLIATTPIDDGTSRLWQCTMKKAPKGVVDDEARALAVGFNKAMNRGLGVHDGEIWATKRAATKIMQLPADGPFGKARIWYSQFFNPRSKAAQILKHISGKHYIKGVPGASVRAAAGTAEASP
jgi:nitrite reductase/ring-hydroxylating ferredoxin subunit